MASHEEEIVARCRDGIEVNFSGNFKEAIFSTKLREMKMPPLWGSTDISNYFDPTNEYKLNSYFYRSPEFVEGLDILAAGCSLTFGIGVPENGTWPSYVAQKSDMTYANLSTPGASIEWIVNSVYRYIDTFGKPKKAIIALFPDFLRGDFAINLDVNRSREIGISDFMYQNPDLLGRKTLLTHHSIFSSTDESAPKFVKRPFAIEDIIPREELIRRAIRDIRNLETFCKSSDITFLWSSWSEDLLELSKSLTDEYKFENFVDMSGLRQWKSIFQKLEPSKTDPEGIVDYKLDHRDKTVYGCTDEQEGRGECVCYSECHFELISEYGQAFHLGTDRYKNGIDNAHFGVHRNIHIAEDFIEKLKEM